MIVKIQAIVSMNVGTLWNHIKPCVYSSYFAYSILITIIARFRTNLSYSLESGMSITCCNSWLDSPPLSKLFISFLFNIL